MQEGKMTLTTQGQVHKYFGWPGRVHDSRVLRNSEIFDRGENGELLPWRPELISGVQVLLFIIGDAAYPLKKWLMKGFPGENLPRVQRVFKQRLSRARMVVERSFGMLKGRWRILLRETTAI